MQSLIDRINIKINNLNSDIESLLHDEFLLTLQDMKKEFIDNTEINLDKYFEKLNGILNIKNDISSNIISYDYIEDPNLNDLYEEEEIISASAKISGTTNIDDLEYTMNTFMQKGNDSYYFDELNEDYGEVKNSLNLSYSLTTLENFKLNSLRISGLKLFDNIFIGRTISTTMTKLISFLFSVNENPFISLCEKNSIYFATSPSNMKKPVRLKENYCYFESDVSDSEAAEMIKIFLKHINKPLSACKVLLSCSTTKKGETYITFIL